MILKTENLTHIYFEGSPFEKKAIENINLEIEKGDFAGLIGHTGCGKSTLIQHFNGLLKPTSGKVIVDGTEISNKGLKELREKVGLVFQYPEHQLFEETVYKDIAFGLKKKKLEENEERKRVTEAAEVVGIDSSLLDRSIYDLSGGQKRRVAIAGVIVMEPKVLILDEPAAGLDPAGRNEILNFIKEIHEKRGLTVILVSHSMEDIAKLANKVIVMNKGSIAMTGAPSEIFRNIDELNSIGLSAPQITRFMAELHKIYPGIDDSCFTVEQAKKELIRYMRCCHV